MKRLIESCDMPAIENDGMKLYDFKGDELKFKQFLDDSIIVIDKENIPISYRKKDGICVNEYDGGYFGTFLYVEDNKDFRDVNISKFKR